ncbi:MAG: hypothetical protein ACQESR_20375 [Planctomycetota bacterium]
MESGPTQAVLPLVGLGGGESHPRPVYFRRLDFSPVESGPTQAVLPLVGLGGGESHPRPV